MMAEPGAAAYPDTVIGRVDGRGAAPEIGVVVQHPAGSTVMLAGGGLAGFGQFVDSFYQWRGAGGYIQYFRGPVIHFEVDIGGVLAAPGRCGKVIPDALQVGGLSAGTGRRYQQVTGILHKQGHEPRITSGTKRSDTGIGGQGIIFTTAKAN